MQFPALENSATGRPPDIEETSAAELIDELRWRGLLYQTTDERSLREHLAAGPRLFYLGFDPSADSLTIGSLLPLTIAACLRRAGHQPVILFGGGTGLIGDPSEKAEERELLTREQVQHNLGRHKEIVQRFLASDSQPEPIFVDNSEWLEKMSAIELLRDIGKAFSVNEMLRRDSVRERFERPDHGISFTEFSYALLQASDFLHLARQYGVTVQIGASDQWGNIVSGVDLVRRRLGIDVHGLTCPLLTRADGTKFGKTERDPVWLSPDRTTPFAFYQFLINLDDDTAKSLLSTLSFDPHDVVTDVLAKQDQNPAGRPAQRHLAAELTEQLHGREARERAEHASEALFYGDPSELDLATIEDGLAAAPSLDLPHSRLHDGLDLVDVLIESGLASSRRDAREHVSNGAVRVNGHRVTEDRQFDSRDLLHDRVLLLRRGRRHWCVIRFHG